MFSPDFSPGRLLLSETYLLFRHPRPAPALLSGRTYGDDGSIDISGVTVPEPM